MLGEPVERVTVLVHRVEDGFLKLGAGARALESGQAGFIGEAASVFDGRHLRWMVLDL